MRASGGNPDFRDFSLHDEVLPVEEIEWSVVLEVVPVIALRR